MKTVRAIVLIVFLLTTSIIAFGGPAIPPTPSEWVTDTAGFLSDKTRIALNSRLQAYQATTGHQVIVWVGKTTGSTPLEDWTVQVFKSWQVGRKGLDDGLVLFIFSDDKRVRIEVGYGLEGAIPDATASKIINDIIIPRIKGGDHDGAAVGAVDQLLSVAGGESVTGPVAPPPPTPLTLTQEILILTVVITLILLGVRYPLQALYILSIFTLVSFRSDT